MKKYLKYTFTFGIIKRLLIIIFLLSNFSFGQSIEQRIENLITKYNKENQLSRQWFHKHAELSNREYLTAERIAQKLKEIGLKPQVGVAKTGVVAILNEIVWRNFTSDQWVFFKVWIIFPLTMFFMIFFVLPLINKKIKKIK